jgi:hypothetical protein
LSTELANLLAKLYIARPDVRAIQRFDAQGEPMYMPELERKDGPRIPWDRAALSAHLAGERTYGHYMLSHSDECKLFAFDVDLEKAGPFPLVAAPGSPTDFVVADLRAGWRDRSQPGRRFLKLKMNLIARALVDQIEHQLGIPAAVAYSGSKGFHVYGFTGMMNAADAREAAYLCLEGLPEWQPSKGDNFFLCENKDPQVGFPEFSIEVFPKQGSLEGKDLGNLMRLPLGRNIKSKDPSFFMDTSGDPYELTPADSATILGEIAAKLLWHQTKSSFGRSLSAGQQRLPKRLRSFRRMTSQSTQT